MKLPVIRSVSFMILVLMTMSSGWAGTLEIDPLAEAESLEDLSFKALMAVEVTGVSRRTEPWATAPAAIYVIGQDAIQDSGRVSIPEVLRLSLGVSVGRQNPCSWAATRTACPVSPRWTWTP